MSDETLHNRRRVAEWDLAPGSAHERPRLSLGLHVAGLAALAVLLVVLARGQWFFYDEWDILSDARQWDLLAPHNGHLSLVPTLAFTLIKLVVGLHTYWPYLALMLAVHLALVHLLWRVLRRVGVHPLIALVAPLIFGVLAPGAENVFWAFQFAFVLPLVVGTAALLLADRPVLTVKPAVVIVVLLVVGLCSSSTSLPMTAIVVLFVLVKHGWRWALLIAAIPGIPYLLWRVIFAHGAATDGLGVNSVGSLLGRVPDVVVHALVDGFGETGPFVPIAGAVALLAVALATWRAIRWPLRKLPLAYYMAFGVLVFVVLTAVSRVQLGTDAAAPGRYVYIEAALALPIAGLAASRLVRSGRGGWWVALAGLLVIGGYNLGGFVQAARNQASIEEFTRLGVLAAAQPQIQRGADADAVPLPVLAPTLTVGEIDQYRAAGQLPSGSSAPGPELSVEAALDLRTRPVAGDPASCESPAMSITFAAGEDRTYIISSSEAQTVDVSASRGGTTTAYVRLKLPAGEQELTGLRDAVVTLSSSDDLFCRTTAG